MDPEGMSNIFNEFFINVGQILSRNFCKIAKNNLVNVNNNVSFDSLFSKKIEISEVVKIVRNYIDDTATGHNKV